MKRKGLCLLTALVVLLSLVLVPSSAASTTNKLKVMAIADPHMLASSLIADTKDYNDSLKKAPKLFTESEGIVDAALDKVRENKPDVLLVVGDMTKDSEHESHKVFARKLAKLKKDLPNLKIYVTDGNHDVNDSKAMNYNTKSGEAEELPVTTPEEFVEFYGVTYNDSSVIARYSPPEGQVSGQLSYVARPKKGYTFIVIDTCRYSADNTSTEEDEHETSGQISEDLEAWVLKQIKAAKKRGDTIIGMGHHNFVPHFTMEPTILGIYLVNDWEQLATEFADAGMSYIFTGHQHAQDVAKMVTDNGNDFYDFQTGATATYPCPIRVVNFQRTRKNGKIVETVKGSTIEDLKVTYKDPVSGKTKTIKNLTTYSKQFQFSGEMFKYRAELYLTDQISPVVADIAMPFLNNAIDDLTGIPVDKSGKHDLLDLVNYMFQSEAAGTDDGNDPTWFRQAQKKVASGDLLDEVLDVLSRDLGGAPEAIAEAAVATLLATVIESATDVDLPLETFSELAGTLVRAGFTGLGIVDPTLKDDANEFLTDLVDSMTNDVNYKDDLTFRIKEVKKNGKTVKRSTEDGTKKPTVYLDKSDSNQVYWLVETILGAGSKGV